MTTIEMPFEMKNLMSFPMENLCFDLKLEVLEQMEPEVVLELAKVNQGFQGMLERDPSIIIGEHVSLIKLDNEIIWIKKFSNSNMMMLNSDDPFSHFSFVKKIRSCNCLSFWMDHQFHNLSFDFILFNDQRCTYQYKLLNNLEAVNQLELVWNSKEAVEGFFSNFHASIRKAADLKIAFDDLNFISFNDQVIEDLIENLIVALKGCDKINFELPFVKFTREDLFGFYYKALLKTQIRNVYINAEIYYSRCISFIQQIITNGIPNKHPKAAICIDICIDYCVDHGLMMHKDDHVARLISENPGMRRIDGEKRLRLLKQADGILFENLRVYSDSVELERSLMFCRRIDSTKDGIYVYENGLWKSFFLAYYVPVDQNDL